jgi:FtsP/CotA-like multicopper oxidase with cupredoxin domain
MFKTKVIVPHIPRRNFLRLGMSVATGIALPTSFVACSRDGGDESHPLQTFIQPPMLEAKNGLLDITLTASYWNTQLSGADPSQTYPVSLRAYGYKTNEPSYSGPTLVVKGGDQLRIKLINNLPFNPPVAAFLDPTNYMKPNTTNLHVHGLHVYPGVFLDKKPLEFGDYVVDPNSGGIQPQGDSRQHVYNLPLDHPAGPFYYHPQYHGSSATQVASLMQGAILVRGPVDDLPEMAQASELVFLFQAPYFANNRTADNYGVGDGKLEKFSQVANHPTGFGLKNSSFGNQNAGYIDAQPVLINGVRQPTIVMESGEVQRWRFINTQTFNYLNLNLDEHVLHQYTMDGYGTNTYQDYPDARQKGGRGIVLSAGNRASVIIKAGAPGTYLLRSLPVKIAQGQQTVVLPGDVLAKIIVLKQKKLTPQVTKNLKAQDQSLATAIPATPLPVSPYLKPITDREFASAGGKKRNIIFNLIGNGSLESIASTQPLWERASAEIGAVAIDAKELFKSNLAKAKQELSKLTGKPLEGSVYYPEFHMPVYEYQLQPSNTMIQNVILGAAEEWTIFNCNSIAHAFHIHVNPMYITKINGHAVEPYWCDTVALPPGGTSEMPTSVTFRMRFTDFVGPYILHSQMLQYSDLGMIQRVTVLPA